MSKEEEEQLKKDQIKNLLYNIRTWLAENGFEVLPNEIALVMNQMIDEGIDKPPLGQVIERIIGEKNFKKLKRG